MFEKRKIARKQGFTLIELLIVIAIISILGSIVLVSMSSYRSRARKTNALAAGRSALPIIINCKDSGMAVNIPSGSETGLTPICTSGFSNSFWAPLAGGYTYVAGGSYNSSLCDFEIDTNGDGPNIVCSCDKVNCG